VLARNGLSLDINRSPRTLDPTLPCVVVRADTFYALSLLHIQFCTECWNLRFGYEAPRAWKGSEVLDTCKKRPVICSDGIRKYERRLSYFSG
jgi:hypothetical protein